MGQSGDAMASSHDSSEVVVTQGLLALEDLMKGNFLPTSMPALCRLEERGLGAGWLMGREQGLDPQSGDTGLAGPESSTFLQLVLPPALESLPEHPLGHWKHSLSLQMPFPNSYKAIRGAGPENHGVQVVTSLFPLPELLTGRQLPELFWPGSRERTRRRANGQSHSGPATWI